MMIPAQTTNSTVIAPRTVRIRKNSVDASRKASLRRPCSSSSVNTGTKAALSAASANSERTTLGTWKAIVKALNAPDATRRSCASGPAGASGGMASATLRRRPMANIHSQKKRILRAERERLENRRYTSTIKTYFRRLQAAVASGDEEAAAAEHRTLVRTIDKAVKRGALHRNTGARKKSRAAHVLRGEPSS